MGTPAVSACRNCGAPAGGKYCPECGQETAVHPPTALEFLHEFVGHYVALEGALWRTLRALLVPGRLTLEYFAGRRRCYVLPLRLYLTASILFFLAARIFMPALDIRVSTADTGRTASVADAIHCDAGDAFCHSIEQRIRAHFGSMTRRQAADYVAGRLVTLFPYAMFVLLPVFALLTRAAYWNRPFNYGEHLVFALHVHAFAFLVGAIVAPVRQPMLLTVPAAIYLALAMKAVFGGRNLPSVVRFVLVFLAYFVLLVAAITVIATAIALL